MKVSEVRLWTVLKLQRMIFECVFLSYGHFLVRQPLVPHCPDKRGLSASYLIISFYRPGLLTSRSLS